MLTFSVIGIYKEGKPEDRIRANRNFQRTFVCIPTETGQ